MSSPDSCMVRVAVDPGVALSVEVTGPKCNQHLLLSNSLGASRGMWDELVQRLKPSIRIVRYDTRGHGRSDVPTGPLTLERLGRGRAGDHGQSPNRASGILRTVPGRVDRLVARGECAEALQWPRASEHRGQFPAAGPVEGTLGCRASVRNGTVGGADIGPLVHQALSGKRHRSGSVRSVRCCNRLVSKATRPAAAYSPKPTCRRNWLAYHARYA